MDALGRHNAQHQPVAPSGNFNLMGNNSGHGIRLDAEPCQLGADVFHLPCEILNLDSLKSVISFEAWNNALTQDERESLLKHLPDNVSKHEASGFVQKLLEDDTFHFGNPGTDMLKRFRAGLLHPRVARLSQALSFLQRKKHYHFVRKYHNSMVRSLLKMKKIWLSIPSSKLKEKLKQPLHVSATVKVRMKPGPKPGSKRKHSLSGTPPAKMKKLSEDFSNQNSAQLSANALPPPPAPVEKSWELWLLSAVRSAFLRSRRSISGEDSEWLSFPSIVQEVRKTPGDDRVLTAEPSLEFNVFTALNVLASKAPPGTRLWKPFVRMQRHDKTWAWCGMLPKPDEDLNSVQAEASAWGVAEKALTKLLERFAEFRTKSTDEKKENGREKDGAQKDVSGPNAMENDKPNDLLAKLKASNGDADYDDSLSGSNRASSQDLSTCAAVNHRLEGGPAITPKREMSENDCASDVSLANNSGINTEANCSNQASYPRDNAEGNFSNRVSFTGNNIEANFSNQGSYSGNYDNGDAHGVVAHREPSGAVDSPEARSASLKSETEVDGDGDDEDLTFEMTSPLRDLNTGQHWRSQSVLKVSLKTRELFQREERRRYANPLIPFPYTALDGGKSMVAPIRVTMQKSAKFARARGHALLKQDRPNHVTILCLVRDAAARLPNGVGSRSDICLLLRASQYVTEDAKDVQVNQTVSGALDRLHYERDPCVRFDFDRKLWQYLHRDRKPEDFRSDGTVSTRQWTKKKVEFDDVPLGQAEDEDVSGGFQELNESNSSACLDAPASGSLMREGQQIGGATAPLDVPSLKGDVPPRNGGYSGPLLHVNGFTHTQPALKLGTNEMLSCNSHGSS